MLFYRLLLTLVAPVLTGFLFMRVLRGKESLQDFLERIGVWRALPRGEVIWLHGASNGEMTSAHQLIDGILRSSPEKSLVLSCNSVSAKEMMLNWGLENTHVRLAPLDLAWIYRRLFARMKVTQFILFEADFWPNRMRKAQQVEVHTALIAGRVSAKSLRMWLRFPSLSRKLFESFDLVCPQDSQSQDRLKQLGVRPSSIGSQISLKSLFKNETTARDFKERAKYWLAASTHDGEDETLLRAHVEAQKHAPDLHMILAPRHPKRGDEIAQIARSLNLTVKQRSKGAQLAQPSDVYIADTLGEMETWYRAASSCFVAGSLVAKGGHTPFEPMSFDCAILHGAHFENFSEPYTALHAQQGALQCDSADELAANILRLLDEDLARLQCDNARKALAQSGTLDLVLEALSQMSKT